VTFYNLSPTPASTSTASKTNSFPTTPPNHRQVQYMRATDKFPFPHNNFTAVVVRFPAACSEPAYRNLVAESKRVLKPAGYLELSILDLDMMNMGNRTRRAIRGLKVKISVAEPEISLAPASDTVLRLVGKRGYHDIKSCRVGVPVASAVSPQKADSRKEGSKNSRTESQEISLADLMKDESSAGDESITKMVAKVGRWWHTQCYEMGVLPHADLSRSVWSDGKVLDECERWGTSFKLLVCYAQKPVVPRRRTASV